ncbi:MAG: hypothetical protein ACSW8J_00895 [bacterium]
MILVAVLCVALSICLVTASRRRFEIADLMIIDTLSHHRTVRSFERLLPSKSQAAPVGAFQFPMTTHFKPRQRQAMTTRKRFFLVTISGRK